MLFLGAFTLLLAFAGAATVPRPSLLTSVAKNITDNGAAELNANTTQSQNPLFGYFFYHIPGTQINLWVKDTGDRLPLNDINAGLHNLGDYIVRQITFHGDGPSSPKGYLQNSVFVNFIPRVMTWKAAGQVIDAMEAIIANDHWTFASHVTIEDQHHGLMGFLTISWRAPDPPSATPSNDGPQPIASLNSHNPLTLNVEQNGTLAERPENPHAHEVPGTHVNLLCGGYGRSLNTDSVFMVLAEAELLVSGKVKQRGPLALVDQVKPIKSHNVELELWPNNRIRWYDLLMALDGVVDFMETYDTFAFTFEIRWQGFRSLGFGQLRPAL